MKILSESDHHARNCIQVRGHRVGRVVAVSEEGVRIDFDGNPHGPMLARMTGGFETRRGEIKPGTEVLLTFDRERSDQPIAIDVMSMPTSSETPPIPIQIDGKRMVITAEDEVVIGCGQASITLRRNGRVAIRGTYVETRALGVHRIRGGTVQVN